METASSVTGFAFQLSFPALDASLRTIFFCLFLVPTLHPDTRKGSVRVHVVLIKTQGPFCGHKGGIEIALIKMDLGFCQPGRETSWVPTNRFCEQGEGSGVMAESELESRFINEILYRACIHLLTLRPSDIPATPHMASLSLLPGHLHTSSNHGFMIPNHFRRPPAQLVNAFCEIRFSPIHGRGIFSRRRIPKGVKMIEYRGELIDKAESNRRGLELFEKSKETGGASVYIFTLNETHDLDGNKPWNPARLINHSCDPNCEMVDEDGKLLLYTLREMRPGEELTFDYGYDIEHFLDHPCRCGAPNCVGYIVSRAQWPRLRRILKLPRLGLTPSRSS